VTGSYKAPPRRERGDSQWADYGVNVGHAVYGDIHVHPPTAWSRRRNATARPAHTTWHVAVRSALTDLTRACGRAAIALADFRPDEVGKEEA
jgi:hypothetical protein